MRAVFLDFGTVSHDDLDTTQLEKVLPGITLHATSTDAEVDERIAGVEFILTNKLNISRARMRAVPGLGAILLLTHPFREYGQPAVYGTWSQSEQFTVPGAPIRELTGKVLGIVGYGV